MSDDLLTPDEVVAFLREPAPRRLPKRIVRAAEKSAGFRASFFDGMIFFGASSFLGAPLSIALFEKPDVLAMLVGGGILSVIAGFGIAVMVKERRNLRRLRKYLGEGAPVMSRIVRLDEPGKGDNLRVQNANADNSESRVAVLDCGESHGERRSFFAFRGPWTRRAKSLHSKNAGNLLALVHPDEPGYAVLAQLWIKDPGGAPVVARVSDGLSAGLAAFFDQPAPREVPAELERRLRAEGCLHIFSFLWGAMFAGIGLLFLTFILSTIWKRPETRDIYTLLLLLFPLPFVIIGLAVMTSPLRQRRKRRRLLAEGRLAKGRVEKLHYTSRKHGGSYVSGASLRYWPEGGGDPVVGRYVGHFSKRIANRLKAGDDGVTVFTVIYRPENPRSVLVADFIEND